MIPVLASAAIVRAADSARFFEDVGNSIERLPGLVRTVPDIIREPSANPLQAVLLLAILIVAILIVVITMVLVLIKPGGRGRSDQAASDMTVEGQPEDDSQPPGPRRRPKRTPLLVGSAMVVGIAVMWVALGYSTAARSACVRCHPDNPHAVAKGRDPHEIVRCVSCHESGGPVARFTINLPSRLEHLFLQNGGEDSRVASAQYGLPISSDSCLGCHASRLNEPITDIAQVIRISHKEPLDAGADCIDCHALAAGAVLSVTVGMDVCIRCHDQTVASAECSTCHIGDPARVARSLEPTGAAVTARMLVRNPQCDGCHESQDSCDACHGIQMPHGDEFMTTKHARAAAIDIWENDGQLCAKCHYEGHRPCTQCHVFDFPAHPASFRRSHQAAEWGGGCTCHSWDPHTRGMVFCQICHESNPKGGTP